MKKETAVIIRNAASYDFGGGERFPVFLGEAISAAYNPIIISRSEALLAFAKSRGTPAIRGWWWSRQNWSGKRVILFPIYIGWQIILFCWYTGVFHKLKPAIVHIQSKDDFIAATIAAKLRGTRVIWTDHADLKHVWLNVEKLARNPGGKLVLWAGQHTDAITLVSESERALIAKHLAKHPDITKKFHIIYNGVQDQYDAYPHQSHENAPVFCVASRLVTDKGIGEAIEAFIRLHRRHSSIRLVIMGDGPEASTFKDQAKTAKGISFLGHVHEPLSVMATSDIFIHPTYHEGFSVALVEASMMALPIIATAVGGNPEIIKDGQTGLLIPAKDSTSLEDAMERVLLDPRLAHMLADNARKQYLDKFEFGAIVNKYFVPLYNGN